MLNLAMGTFILFIFSFTLALAHNDKPVLKHSDFLQNLKNTSVSAQAKQNARGYNYLFVSGFFNEFLSGYYSDNYDYLRNLGVERKQIFFHYPSSNTGLYENADILSEFLKQASKDNSKKWVIISHSKGGFESLLYAAKYKKDFLKKVHKLHIVQAAFGTPVADYAEGLGAEIDEQMGVIPRLNCRLASVGRHLLDPKISGGIQALTSEMSQKTIHHLFANYGAALKEVRTKIFYSTSQAYAKDITPLLYCPSHYLETYYGESDGLILVKDQFLKGSGTLWSHFLLDHSDLTLAYPFSSKPAKYRYAFMKSIIESL